MKGISTKPNEVFGYFRPGGIGSKLKYKDFLMESTQIRIDNGQNKLFVYFLTTIRILRNFKKFIFN